MIRSGSKIFFLLGPTVRHCTARTIGPHWVKIKKNYFYNKAEIPHVLHYNEHSNSKRLCYSFRLLKNIFPAPEYQTCKRDDPSFSECLKNAIQDALSRLGDGMFLANASNNTETLTTETYFRNTKFKNSFSATIGCT